MNTPDPITFVTQDFDWDSIEPDMAGMIEAGATIVGARTVRDVVAWINAGDRKQSILMRSRFAWWVLDGAQRNTTLTELAKSIGCKKQAMGRIASDFRDRFKFTGPSAKTEAARRAYRKLQAIKKATQQADA